MDLDEFLGPFPDARPIYKALARAVESLGPSDVRVTKSQVAFGRDGHAFAWAWVPGRYLRGPKAPLVVSIALRRRDASPRWKEVVEPRPGRFMHHLEMDGVEDIDDQVLAWLAEAREGA